MAELTTLAGFDEDLAAESTRLRNRIRGLLTQIHPSLERVLGRRLDHPGVLALLEAFPIPSAMAAAERDALLEVVRPHAPRLAERLITDVLTALDEQTVVVAGTSAAATILPHLTSSLRSILHQRDTVAAQVEHLLEDHPLSPVLTSMPGIAVRTAARILVEIGDARGFRSAAHLAAYAGLAPATRRSGSSIRGENPSRRGNKQLKRALYLSTFAALRPPPITRLLPAETQRRQTPRRRTNLPGPPPRRRPVRRRAPEGRSCTCGWEATWRAGLPTRPVSPMSVATSCGRGASSARRSRICTGYGPCCPPKGNRLTVTMIMEPTRNAWVPLTAWFHRTRRRGRADETRSRYSALANGPSTAKPPRRLTFVRNSTAPAIARTTSSPSYAEHAHQRITPSTPRHNGKSSSYNRILAEEFLYARVWTSEHHRTAALQVWNLHYNCCESSGSWSGTGWQGAHRVAPRPGRDSYNYSPLWCVSMDSSGPGRGGRR